MRKRWTAVCGVGLGLVLAVAAATLAHAEARVLVIPKSTEEIFWKNVAAGARKAGEELRISVTYRGTKSVMQHDAQKQIIAYGIRQLYNAIVLAPNHVSHATPTLERAVDLGIKLVLIDSNMAGGLHHCFIESDNYLAGQKAADTLAAAVGGRGRVALVRYLEHHASTREREQGFLDAMRERHPRLTLVADPHAGPSIGSAYRIVASLLDGPAPPDAIFTDAEATTLGTLRAINERGLEGRVTFVGFDFNDTIKSAILNGEMAATIIQDPFQMGYLGVKTATDLVRGRAVPPKIYTETFVVDADNYHTKMIQAVLGTHTPLTQ